MKVLKILNQLGLRRPLLDEFDRLNHDRINRQVLKNTDALGWHCLDFFDHIHAFDDSAKRRVTGGSLQGLLAWCANGLTLTGKFDGVTLG